MSDTKAKLNAALKEAMTNKDNARRDVVRLVQSGIKQIEVDTRKEATEDDVLTMIQREVKKRRESIDEARKIGRTDIVDAETAELVILESFLPQQLTRDEITALARDAIAQSGAASAKEMGKVMGLLMPKVKGKADGSLVTQVVKELLS